MSADEQSLLVMATNERKRKLRDSVLTEEVLRSFWNLVDKKYFDNKEGIWEENHPYGTCTWVNSSPFRWIEKGARTVEIYGGDEKACSDCGLTTTLGMITGHDWLFVSGRWLIDIWAWAYLGAPQCLYDLWEPTHVAWVDVLYPKRWERNENAEKWSAWFDLAERDWNELLSK